MAALALGRERTLWPAWTERRDYQRDRKPADLHGARGAEVEHRLSDLLGRPGGQGAEVAGFQYDPPAGEPERCVALLAACGVRAVCNAKHLELEGAVFLPTARPLT